MTTYPPVRQVGAGDSLRDDVHAWIESPPLRDLVVAFGGDTDEIYRGDAAGEWLARLDRFSDQWDTRGGAERNLARSLDLTDEQQRVVSAAAEALGLTAGRPPRSDRYDQILMLGGLVRACISRPAYAAHLIESGQVRADAVTALGGHRPFGGDEYEIARLAGLDAVSDEFSALDAGTRRAFRLGEPDREEGSPDAGNSSWTIRSYTSSDGTVVRVAAAPSSDPEHRRANTADTYAWFAGTVSGMSPGQSVLIVTTAIYLPAQHPNAIRMLGLPHGIAVETVGIQSGDVISELKNTFTPSQYLQEIRSAIRSLRDLYAAIPPE